MELPFKIPIQLNDLLKPSQDYYYVRNTYTIEDIPDKLQGKFIFKIKFSLASI